MNAIELILKNNAQFLNCDNWIPDKTLRDIWNLKIDEGSYEIAVFGKPDHFDRMVLCASLKCLSKNKFMNDEINTSILEVINSIHIDKQSSIINKVAASVDKWCSMSIEFKGIFYKGGGSCIRGFRVINEFIYTPETNELYIRFNHSFLNKVFPQERQDLLPDFTKQVHISKSKRLLKREAW